MSVIYMGRVTVKGLAGTIAYTGTGSVAIADATMSSRSVNATDELDSAEVTDKRGEVIGVAVFNRRKRVTVEFVPLSASGTNTEADCLAKALFPALVAATPATYKITLAAFGAELTGDYNYLGGATLGMTSEGFPSISIPCVQYGGAAMTATAGV